jgi:hypothetical protein
MSNKLKAAACALSVLFLLGLATGCGVQTYPNQINAFDGASYDSLTLAHGALTSLRSQIAVNYPKYDAVFNEAAAAYNVALTGYSEYRITQANQADVAAETTDLTAAIINLETAFQTDMQVSPAYVLKLRKKAEGIRRFVKRRGVSVTDILDELEIAAAIARAVPAAAPYAAVAQMVISSTDDALSAEEASAGEPIDLTTIQAITPIQ